MTIVIVWKDNTKQEAWLSVAHDGVYIVQDYFAATSARLKWWMTIPPVEYEQMVQGIHNPGFDGPWNKNEKPVNQ